MQLDLFVQEIEADPDTQDRKYDRSYSYQFQRFKNENRHQVPNDIGQDHKKDLHGIDTGLIDTVQGDAGHPIDR
jgi:hypothetical protein